MPRAADAGFVLVELLVVMGILGIVLAIGVPNYLNYASNQRTREAAKTLAADLRMARQEAIARRAAMTMSLSSADESCGAHSASFRILQGSMVIKHTCFPPDVQFASLSAPRVTFEALGIPLSGLTVQVRSARTARTFEVKVLAETGSVVDDSR